MFLSQLNWRIKVAINLFWVVYIASTSARSLETVTDMRLSDDTLDTSTGHGHPSSNKRPCLLAIITWFMYLSSFCNLNVVVIVQPVVN